jgi:hypothetical protein
MPADAPPLTLRWLEEEEYPGVNSALALQGWARINERAARVLGAFEGERLVTVLVLQLYPIVGPLLRLDGRDNGEVSRALADEMVEFLDATGARGFLVVCDNPFVERICRRYGMTRVEQPIFADEHL